MHKRECSGHNFGSGLRLRERDGWGRDAVGHPICPFLDQGTMVVARELDPAWVDLARVALWVDRPEPSVGQGTSEDGYGCM